MHQNTKDVNPSSEYLKIFLTGDFGCFAPDTIVTMYPYGFKKIQEIKVGDTVMGDDSKPRHVLELFSGKEEMYRIKYHNDTYYDVNASHSLVLVATARNKGCKIGDIIEVPVKEYANWTHWQKKAFLGLKTGVEYPEIPVLIPPYILGVWLGDGTHDKPEFTNEDKIVVGIMQLYAEANGLSLTNSNEDDLHYRIINPEKGGRKNIFLEDLRSYNLIRNKHIPKEYLFNSKENRLRLLAGLLDTDGSLDRDVSFEITQKRQALAEDILFLAQSCGMNASINEKTVNYRGENRLYYRVCISRNITSIPIQIERKQPSQDLYRQRNNLHFGFSILPLGKGKYYGFELDGNHRFLLGDFTIVRNTGKSVFASSCPAPGFLFDFDDGAQIYRNKDFDYESYSLSAHGWVKFEKDLREIKKEVEAEKYQTVVVDSTTSMTDIAMERALQLDPKRSVTGGPLWNVHYQIVKNLMEGKLRQIISLPCNIIVITHLQVIQDQETGAIIGVEPLLTGQLSKIVPGYFGEVYCAFSKQVAKKVGGGKAETVFYLRTVPRGHYKARSRLSGKERLLPDEISNSYEALQIALKEGLKREKKRKGVKVK